MPPAFASFGRRCLGLGCVTRLLRGLARLPSRKAAPLPRGRGLAAKAQEPREGRGDTGEGLVPDRRPGLRITARFAHLAVDGPKLRLKLGALLPRRTYESRDIHLGVGDMRWRQLVRRALVGSASRSASPAAINAVGALLPVPHFASKTFAFFSCSSAIRAEPNEPRRQATRKRVGAREELNRARCAGSWWI